MLALAWAGVVPTPVRARDEEVLIQEGHRRFAADYVAAVNSQDVERLRRLIHPKSLACITDQNRDFFDELFTRDLRRRLVGPFRVVSVSALTTNATGAPLEMATYPIAPTHRIQIDVQTGPTSSVTVIRDLLLNGTVWLAVVPCPTANGLGAFRAARRASAEQQARATALVAQLREPLRSELTGLLQEGRRVEAMKRYSAASGEGLTMVKRVVDLLAPQE